MQKDNLFNTGTTSEESILRAGYNTEFGYFRDLAESRNVTDLKQRIQSITENLGFSHYVFSRLSCSENNLREINNLPQEIPNIYYESGLFEHDVTPNYAIQNSTPIFQSDIHSDVSRLPANIDISNTMLEIKKLNESFGFYDYFNLPIDAVGGNGKVMLSVTQRGLSPYEFKTMTEQHKASLHLLARAIDWTVSHKYASELIRSEAPSTFRITPKPLRVLEALANNDLNVIQIAEKLFISPVTANKHLENVRRSLGVKTNHGAIKKAIMLNLITYKK